MKLWIFGLLAAAVLCGYALRLATGALFVVGGDEDQYIWGASYYEHRLSQLNFGPGPDPTNDPGFRPDSYWSLTQPSGVRLLYAIALLPTRFQAPVKPLTVRNVAGPGAQVEAQWPIRLYLRFVASTTALAALILLAWRFGPTVAYIELTALYMPGLIALLGVSADDPQWTILHPLQAAVNLAGAWAEGPTFLGLALVLVAFKRRLFGPALGLAAAFKLTALGLWPLLIFSAHKKRDALLALATWTVLNPPSWYLEGPPYLLVMLWDRWHEYALQRQAYGAIWLPSRYFIPVDMALIALILLGIRHRDWLAIRLPQLRRQPCLA